jgi:hypothetical protein
VHYNTLSKQSQEKINYFKNFTINSDLSDLSDIGNYVELASASSTTSNITVDDMSKYKSICVCLLKKNSSNQLECLIENTIPYSLFKTLTGALYVTYSTSTLGTVHYNSDTSINITVTGSIDSVRVYGVK